MSAGKKWPQQAADGASPTKQRRDPVPLPGRETPGYTPSKQLTQTAEYKVEGSFLERYTDDVQTRRSRHDAQVRLKQKAETFHQPPASKPVDPDAHWDRVRKEQQRKAMLMAECKRLAEEAELAACTAPEMSRKSATLIQKVLAERGPDQVSRSEAFVAAKAKKRQDAVSPQPHPPHS